jgi:hypothetical protein
VAGLNLPGVTLDYIDTVDGNLQDVGCDLRQRCVVPVPLTHRAGIDGGTSAGVDADPGAFPAAATEAARCQPPRRRHAAHVGVGGNADATIAAFRAQFVALDLAPVVVEGFQCDVQAALIVPAVVDHGRTTVGLIGKIGSRNEISSAHLDLIQHELACHRVDRAFRDVSAFGPAVAAIGIDRYGVGYDDSGECLVVLDPVGAGPEIDSVYRGTSRRHIGKIGANVAQRFHLEAEDFAIVTECDLDRLGMGAAMARGLVTLGARFPPLHRDP